MRAQKLYLEPADTWPQKRAVLASMDLIGEALAQLSGLQSLLAIPDHTLGMLAADDLCWLLEPIRERMERARTMLEAME